MSAQSLVVVDGVSRYFGALCAIDNLNLQVARGEIVGFLGPNGAGKSTAMQVICGALAPSSGTVSIGGHDLFNDARAAKTQIGYLPETPPLYQDLTVDEYLDFCACLHGIDRRRQHDARHRVKKRCGVADSGARLIRNLSKGYRQRVGIAQAIIHSPPIIVLDEPTEGLDPNQMREIRSLIGELGREHSVILCTHLLPEVQSVCQRVLILHEGQLVFDQALATLDSAVDGVNGTGVQSLRVTVKHPPALDQWRKLTGVVAATTEPNQRVRVEYQANVASIEDIATQIVAAGWGLAELTPRRQTLEEVFVRLTCGQGVAEKTV